MASNVKLAEAGLSKDAFELICDAFEVKSAEIELLSEATELSWGPNDVKIADTLDGEA